MTDRVRTLVVVLAEDMRTDDVERIVNAISMVKGVADVKLGAPVTLDTWATRTIVLMDGHTTDEKYRRVLQSEIVPQHVPPRLTHCEGGMLIAISTSRTGAPMPSPIFECNRCKQRMAILEVTEPQPRMTSDFQERSTADVSSGEALSGVRVSSATYDTLFSRFFDDDLDDADMMKLSSFVDEAIARALLPRMDNVQELHRCLDVIAVAEREWQAMKDTLDRSQASATSLLTRARLAEEKLSELHADIAHLRHEMGKNTIDPLQVERYLDRILASIHPSPEPTE